MFLIARFIQNATDIYSLILVAFALLSQFAGLDFTVWIAVILLRYISRYLINFLLMI